MRRMGALGWMWAKRGSALSWDGRGQGEEEGKLGTFYTSLNATSGINAYIPGSPSHHQSF